MLLSWLALTDDAFVPELRQCLFVPNEIQQVSLPSDTAGRSAKLFYLLQQGVGEVGPRTGDPPECFYAPRKRCSWLRRCARAVPPIFG